MISSKGKEQYFKRSLLFDPIHWLPPLEAAVRDMADAVWDPSVGKGKGMDLRVGLEGSFGDSQTTPRLLSSSRLGQMVCLHGIITSCSLVRPKVLKSVHWSEQRHCFLQKEYRDPTMLIPNALPTGTSYPTVGENGERLISEFGLSTYRDYQTAAMQEMPEEAPAGQLPRTVEVCLEGDLVDAVKPGDRVNIVGVYKSISQSSNGSVPPVFKVKRKDVIFRRWWWPMPFASWVLIRMLSWSTPSPPMIWPTFVPLVVALMCLTCWPVPWHPPSGVMNG